MLINISPDSDLLQYNRDKYTYWLGMYSLDKSMIIAFAFCDDLPEDMEGFIVINH